MLLINASINRTQEGRICSISPRLLSKQPRKHSAVPAPLSTCKVYHCTCSRWQMCANDQLYYGLLYCAIYQLSPDGPLDRQTSPEMLLSILRACLDASQGPACLEHVFRKPEQRTVPKGNGPRIASKKNTSPHVPNQTPGSEGFRSGTATVSYWNMASRNLSVKQQKEKISNTFNEGMNFCWQTKNKQNMVSSHLLAPNYRKSSEQVSNY